MRFWKCVRFWVSAARASSLADFLALWQARSHRWSEEVVYEEVEVMHETRVSLVLGVASPGRGKRLYHWNIFLYNLCRHNQKGNIMKKKTTTMHRQGDVLFVKVDALPEALTEWKNNVLVEGEVTGHAHRLQEGKIWETPQGLLFLAAVTGSQIVHEEHNTINLEPGYWQVIRQREYSPEAIRWVTD
jgi:hypothetical protein